MPAFLQTTSQVVLLREVASGPLSAQFVAERSTPRGVELVAVKVILERLARGAENLVRVRDRGRDLARLRQRHLVPVEDLLLVGNHLALTSTWIDGIDLLEWVEVLQETGTALPGRAVCEIIRATAVALDAALHRVPWDGQEPLGLCHWDLKPSNLMVDRDGDVLVLDHGAGFTSLAGRHARLGALQKGLTKYLAPERRAGKRGGAPSDVYSLGVIGLELFRGAWLRRLRQHNPAHDRYLAEVVANLTDMGMRSAADDSALRNLLLRMVAWDPDARPSAAEVAQTFRTLGDRANGASLVGFAQQHALPWLEPGHTEGDPELGRVATQVVDRWTPELDQLDTMAEAPRLLQRRIASEEWEETATGWQPSTGEMRRPDIWDDVEEDPPSDPGALLSRDDDPTDEPADEVMDAFDSREITQPAYTGEDLGELAPPLSEVATIEPAPPRRVQRRRSGALVLVLAVVAVVLAVLAVLALALASAGLVVLF